MGGIEEKVHYVVVTGVIRNKDGRYLICKRSPDEDIFPNKWCVPGGKIEMDDFVNSPKDTSDHWLDVLEKSLEKEIFEETGLKIKNIGYASNSALIRPNGFSTIIISLYAEYAGGKVKLDGKELVAYAWVSLEEAKDYDLIESLYKEIEKVDGFYNERFG